MRLFNRIFKRTLTSPRNRLASALLNLNFLSGNLDNRITFGRTTNATVTNAQGLVANAPMNLLTFSEQFDNAAWTKTNATITANAAIAPNGTLTADKFVEAVGAGSKYISTAVFSPNVYVFSIDIKYSNKQYFWASIDGSTTAVFFDVLNGTVASTGSGNTGSITPSGGGWYRCTVTKTTASSFGLYFGTSNSPSSYETTGNGVDGIYIWGAQLELGSTATTYNPTTVKNLLGFTENFDNAAWTKSNAFVQTNLVLQSQVVGGTSWITNSTFLLTALNDAVAPDGTQTATKFTDTTSSGGHSLYQNISITAGNTYTFSVYGKKGTLNFIWLKFNDRVTNWGTTFNVDTGVVGATLTGFSAPTSTSITSVGNGWYRCSITVTAGATGTGAQDIGITTTSGVRVYVGAGQDAFIWGAQLVQGTTPGDYKATYAAAAAVGYTDIYGQPFAQKLVANTSNIEHLCRQTLTLSATTYTLSVYAKAGEYSWLCLTGVSFANAKASFNLSAGTVGTVSGSGSPAASVVAVSDGWYLCSLVFTASASASTYGIALANANDSTYFAGNGTSGIYIFGAQLSDSASVDPYVYQPVAAPSSVAYYGPRFDYDPVTLASKGLLIEEQRTNLLLYSTDFTNIAWSKNGSTVTANSAVAPDGTNTATLLTVTPTSELYQQQPFAGGANGTVSVWVKAAATGSAQRARITTNNALAWDTGISQVITLTNQWQRVVLSGVLNSSSSVARVVISSFDASRNSDSTCVGNVLIWGAQLETGAFATSYIPTVASQVTRAADSASMIGNNFARWYTQGPGTIFGESQILPGATNNRLFFVGDGTGNNYFSINMVTSGTAGSIVTGSAIQTDSFPTVAATSGVYYKQALAYAINDAASSRNGAAVNTDTSVVLPTVNFMGIGFLVSGGSLGSGYIKRIAYYNRRLSNTELQGITS